MAEALVKSIKKAFDALDYVMQSSRSGTGATLSDIAESLDEKQTTMRNILKTMEACDYLAREGKLYVPGAKNGDLARTNSREALIKVASPILTQAAKKCGESFVLTSVYNGRREVISRYNGSNEIGVNTGVVEGKHVYTLVTTRIFLAFASGIERENFYKTNGLPGDEWPEAKDGKLEHALEKLQKAGFAAERNKSLCAYAFPLIDSRGNLLASIGAYAPAFRINKKAETELLKVLSGIAEKVKKQI
ncbi:MAG: helix-turn-helix domain-containing protein [Kiritimatiellae bacterium]|jgi:DNA-binding IclR family transcriptional regulator|nr:helix-turn-helix domain-containing protein [Kiritimatiellia bacterium]